MASPLLIAGLQAAGQIIGGGINAISQGSINRRTRQYNREMYARQREDALADWNRMNEYNAPSAQMARYEAAGLNKNLIYGQPHETSPLRSVNAEGWRPEAPRFDFVSDAVTGGILTYWDYQKKEQELENLKAQETLLAQENALRAAQVQSVTAGTDRTRFDLDLAGELRKNSIDMANQQLLKSKADTAMTLDENDRRAAQNVVTLQQGVEAILTSRLSRAKTEDERELIRQQIANAKKDETLKQLDIDLKRTGVQPGDELWQRLIARAVSKLEQGGSSVKEVFEWFKGPKKATSKEVDVMKRKAREFQEKNSRKRNN